jgi:hypothetical protein
MYKRIRDPSKRNASPVVVTRERTTKTFRQTKAYVLCADCEQRFNLYGEDWMLKKLGAGKRFPLRERLDVAIPMSTGPEVKKYSCVKAGIDSEKLGYFALSMLWRGAIHEWQDPLGSPIPKLDLGDMEEPMRRYLLGDGPFPDGIVVIVRVCDDSMSRETLINPIPAGGVGHYEMLTLGVQFETFVGAAIDPQCRERAVSVPPTNGYFGEIAAKGRWDIMLPLRGRASVPNKLSLSGRTRPVHPLPDGFYLQLHQNNPYARGGQEKVC